MKIIPVMLFLHAMVISVSAQTIYHTSWKGTLLIPHSVEVKFTFKKDTLYIKTETGDEIGTLAFSLAGDTLMIKKISGPSPCPEQAQGTYLFKWFENGNKFQLQAVGDDCEGRIGVFTLNSFQRISGQ